MIVTNIFSKYSEGQPVQILNLFPLSKQVPEGHFYSLVQWQTGARGPFEAGHREVTTHRAHPHSPVPWTETRTPAGMVSSALLFTLGRPQQQASGQQPSLIKGCLYRPSILWMGLSHRNLFCDGRNRADDMSPAVGRAPKASVQHSIQKPGQLAPAWGRGHIDIVTGLACRVACG